MTLPPALTQTSFPAADLVAEERVIFLPTEERADRVLLGEQALSVFADRLRTPYIEQLTAAGVHIRLTDWVGRLPFRLIGERSVSEHAVTVYPAKLARDPEEAFAALGQMLAQVAQWERDLRLTPTGFPGTALPGAAIPAAGLSASSAPVPSPPLPGALGRWAVPARADELLEVAQEAWALWQAARRRSGPLARPSGQRERRVAGGQVPDRVDWPRTLEAWGQGRFPEHVALDLWPPPPLAAPALLGLWDALIHAAQTLPEGEERGELLGRLGAARAALLRLGRIRNGGATDDPASDPASRRAHDLTERVRSMTRQTAGWPQGSVRMAELYEFWAQLALARTLGAEEGEVTRTPDGTGQGTLRGQVAGAGGTLSVTLNPKLTFGGVGLASQTLQPDLCAVLGTGGSALVADAKYRPLDRLNAEGQREINDQLLRYMGLLHASTGLILWPGLGAEDEGERCRVSTLPGGRARLVRLRLHPADPPQQLAADLRRLGVLPAGGGPFQGAL